MGMQRCCHSACVHRSGRIAQRRRRSSARASITGVRCVRGGEPAACVLSSSVLALLLSFAACACCPSANSV
jgi:hypothetical protein